MQKRRVVVTGLGCISPVGNTVDDLWSALNVGKSGVQPITVFDASDMPVVLNHIMTDSGVCRQKRFQQCSILMVSCAVVDHGLVAAL